MIHVMKLLSCLLAWSLCISHAQTSASHMALLDWVDESGKDAVLVKFSLVLWQCWLANRKGIWPVKNLQLSWIIVFWGRI